jgi:phospholipase C
VSLSIVNAYDPDAIYRKRLARGERLTRLWPLADSYGWYDISIDADQDQGFTRRLAGHVESNARVTVSDPAFGRGGTRVPTAAEASR